MTIAEGVSARVCFKSYATGVITSNSQPVSTVDPAVTGGQILRRVSSSLALVKDTYQSAEVRSDRQIADFRHGVKRVTGSITGELSPSTYFELMEAALRCTRVSAVALSNSDLTTCAADNTTSTFTFSGGDPPLLGLRVGHILRFTNLSETLNNATNFIITGFSGTSNRVVAVYPAPTTMGADAAWSLTTTGKHIFPPASSHVSRKFAFEVNMSDTDNSLLFTECRIAGFNLGLPATGMATIDIPVMGRDAEPLADGSSPFFTSPTAATTTGICAAVNGVLYAAGVRVGVVTGIQINFTLNPSSDAVVGQNFVPEIFLGRVTITGSMTAFFESLTLYNLFRNETEAALLVYLTTTSAVNSPAISVTLPRIKFGSGSPAIQGEGGVQQNFNFQALKYETGTAVATGIENATIFIHDTEQTS